jgi:hypothetical protein
MTDAESIAAMTDAELTAAYPMPDWFPDLVRELAALTPEESREVDRWLAEREREANASKSEENSSPKRRRRKASLAAALKQAAKAGKPVKGATLGVEGVKLEFGEPAEADPLANEWDEVFRREPH